MNLEGLQQVAYESVTKTFKAMTDIVTGETPDTKIEDRLVAAKIIESMNDTIIKAWLASDFAHGVEKNTDKISRQIDKLINNQ